MIRGVGIDLAVIDRFRNAEPGLLDRILAPADRDYIAKFADPSPHIAGFWAAKEALVKALSRTDIAFNRVAILHEPNGRPYFDYHPDEGRLHLSISHEKEHAVAVVIWEA
ncbi:MAG TPA: holo-ACP synthase [bacterium]|nr:holo-ACP synthase [bacterium]